MLGGILVLGGTAHGDDAAKCEAAKLKLSSQYAACRLKAESKAVKKGDLPDYSKCDTKFSGKWASAESNGGGMCPSNGDLASMQSRITGCADDIAACLTGTCPGTCGDGTIDAGEDCDLGSLGGESCATQGFAGGTLRCGSGCAFDTSDCWSDRFVDNGDGTVTDRQSGLTWEKKVDVCPAEETASGHYTTNLSNGTFTSVVDASGTSWTGTADDSILGYTSDCGGMVEARAFDVTYQEEVAQFSGSCFSGSVQITGTILCEHAEIDFTISGAASGSGYHYSSSLNLHALHGLFSWSTGTNKPDGTVFTEFLGALNRSTAFSDTVSTGCFAGHCDWRLPTIDESRAIVIDPDCEDNNIEPCIPSALGPPLFYRAWTSTNVVSPDSDRAFTLDEHLGALGSDSKTELEVARAVRGGP